MWGGGGGGGGVGVLPGRRCCTSCKTWGGENSTCNFYTTSLSDRVSRDIERNTQTERRGWIRRLSSTVAISDIAEDEIR